LFGQNRVTFGIGCVSLLLIFSLIIGCSGPGSGSPKDVVIKLFGAMERDDRAGIINLLDMPSLMNISEYDYALQRKEPRVFHNPEKLLDDLTGYGLTKTVWFDMQRIVGNTEIHGDSAFVEVSFIDKEASKQYYNKFGLRRINDQWRIYSFRTMTGKESSEY